VGPINCNNKVETRYSIGRLHSFDDGCAVENNNGDKFWYRKGELHRKGGPAIVFSNGDKEWYKKGRRHKSNGPAVERINGDKHWFKRGKYHRKNGPAIEWGNGNNDWYYEGTRINCSSTKEFLQIIKLTFVKGMRVVKYRNRTETRNNKNECHSFNDEPAIIYSNGTKVWYKEGKHHRENGPTCEWFDGYKEWYYEGNKVKCSSNKEFIKMT